MSNSNKPLTKGIKRLIQYVQALVKQEKSILLIYLYGSYARDQNLPLSDIDIAVLYDQEEITSIAKRKQKLLLLYDFFETTLPGYEFDIKILNDAPFEFAYNVIKGKLLYESSITVRVEFETYILSRYLDIKPYLNYYKKMQIKNLLGD